MRVPNKRAKGKYDILKRFEAGIVLNGLEVKAVQRGRADLSRAFGKVVGGELFLFNLGVQIPGTHGGVDSRRSRKLLVHRKEIETLVLALKSSRLTIVPLSLYNKGRLVKVELGLARERRKYEKREALRRRDIDREVERELKSYK